MPTYKDSVIMSGIRHNQAGAFYVLSGRIEVDMHGREYDLRSTDVLPRCASPMPPEPTRCRPSRTYADVVRHHFFALLSCSTAICARVEGEYRFRDTAPCREVNPRRCVPLAALRAFLLQYARYRGVRGNGEMTTTAWRA